MKKNTEMTKQYSFYYFIRAMLSERKKYYPDFPVLFFFFWDHQVLFLPTSRWSFRTRRQALKWLSFFRVFFWFRMRRKPRWWERNSHWWRNHAEEVGLGEKVTIPKGSWSFGLMRSINALLLSPTKPSHLIKYSIKSIYV